jgi:hypothetical protein
MKQRLVTDGYSDGDWLSSVYDKHQGYPSNAVIGTRTYWMRQNSFHTVDERSSNSVKGRKQWHNFSHYKKVALPSLTSFYDNTQYPLTLEIGDSYHAPYDTGVQPRSFQLFDCSTFGSASSPIEGLPALFSLDSSGELFIEPPNGLDQLLGIAFERLLPGIRPKLSLVNSIIELKDWVTLKETFRHAGDILNRLILLNNFRRTAFKGLSFRQIARRRSSDYLQYKFNLAPLYSDIKGVFSSFKSYQAQIMRLVAQAEKVNTRHTIISIDDYAGAPTFESESTYHQPFPVSFNDPLYRADGLRTRSHRRVTYEPSKFHLECEFNYSFSRFQIEHARFFGLMDSLGVNFNPAIIWNAMPWTFVADWVVSVSSYLSKFAERQMEPVVNIRRCLWSIKRSRSIECSFDALYGLAANPASTVTETAYRRQLCWPTPASLRVSGLNPTEISLGAALVLSRRPRHPST